MKKYTVTARFRDQNQPRMTAKCLTQGAAVNQVSIWSNQFAGLSSLAIFTPEGEKHCYDPAGNYIFTIPAEGCKALGLKG